MAREKLVMGCRVASTVSGVKAKPEAGSVLFVLQAGCNFCDHWLDRKDVIKMQLRRRLQVIRKKCHRP